MKTYIVHYKKLVERKNYLSKFFPDAIWVDEYDRDTITPENMKIYNPTEELWFNRIKDIYINLPEYRALTTAEICNYLSHLKILEMMIKDNDFKALVLEDDIILNSDFKEKLESVIKELPDDFDIIFLGTSHSVNVLENAVKGSVPIKMEKGKRVYKRIPPITRTVDSYVITLDAAKKLYNAIDNIILPYDWDVNYFFKKMHIDVYWCVPGITRQGSMTGNYQSSIR